MKNVFSPLSLFDMLLFIIIAYGNMLGNILRIKENTMQMPWWHGVNILWTSKFKKIKLFRNKLSNHPQE